MAMTFSFIILVSCVLSGFHSLDYKDLAKEGVSCPDRDSCSGIRNKAFFEKNCECDIDCAFYGDCCIDSQRTSIRGRLPKKTTASCTAFGGKRNVGVYMINKCRKDFAGPEELLSKCQGPQDLTDPVIAAPTTDAANGITYRNRYCAECNSAVPSQLTTWSVKVKCDDLVSVHNVSDDHIWGHLEYESNNWGVNHRHGGRTQFYPCELIFDLPEGLENSVRMCRADVVSSCPRKWRQATTKAMCGAYMAIVVHTDKQEYTIYRNIHCALCNEIQEDTLSCKGGIWSRKKQPMSFAFLVDINMSDGNSVGVSHLTTPRCPSKQKYDPFAKRCRRLSCALPGFVIVDGKCVKK